MRDYSNNWIKIKKLGSGGQGTTLLTKRLSDENILGAVKLLNRQDNLERRARMYRETTALETLSHNNIPKVLGSNTSYWQDLSYKLYIATEYINGSTLQELNLEKESFENKVNLVKKIAEVVGYCHKRGIIHRDIKPDNVICRNDSISDPVLLDFGMSFNFNLNDDDDITSNGQQIGNRFLILPEQKIGEASKRDLRSDVTCIAGLLFYFLTGLRPIVISDEKGNKPHQREDARLKLEKLPKIKYDYLNYIFDIAFIQQIDYRWQSAEALIEQLDYLLNIKSEEMESNKDLLDTIKKKMQSVDYLEAKYVKDIFGELNKRATDVCTKLYIELGPDWGYNQNGFPKNEFEYRNLLAPYNFVKKELRLSTVIYAYITGVELVVNVYEKEYENNMKELFRYPISNVDWEQFENKLRIYYLSELAVL